jgi:putative MATE family efflux protein
MGLEKVWGTKKDQAIRKKVLLLAWPVIVENLLQMTVGIFDTIMVGHMHPVSLASAALAGVGISDQICLFLLAVFAALGVGTTALVAQFTGAKKDKEARLVGEQSMLVGCLLSIVLGIIIKWKAKEIISFLGADENVTELGTAYLTLVGGLNISLVVMVICNGVLRGIGDTKTPMLITGLVNVINIVLDYLLIYGKLGFPALGVTGAALATVIARVVGSAILIYILYHKPGGKIRLSWKSSFVFMPEILGKISRISVPVALEQIMLRGGQIVYAVIVTSLGTIAFAAHKITLNAESLSFMPGFGFAVAATTLVGQEIGRERLDRAEANGYMANRLAMVIMVTMGVVFFFFAAPLVGLFSNDPEVITLAASCLRIVAISQPALCLTMVFAGALRGAGDTKIPMVITGASIWLIRLPFAYLLGIKMGYGLQGAWLAMNIDLFFRGGLMYLRFRRNGWKQLYLSGGKVHSGL